MPGLPDLDPDGLLEYSVVFTDRSLNHMSQTFQGVMTEISSTLKRVYNSHSVALVPGRCGLRTACRNLFWHDPA